MNEITSRLERLVLGVAKPNFASKYSCENSWRHLQDLQTFPPFPPKHFSKESRPNLFKINIGVFILKISRFPERFRSKNYSFIFYCLHIFTYFYIQLYGILLEFHDTSQKIQTHFWIRRICAKSCATLTFAENFEIAEINSNY